MKYISKEYANNLMSALKKHYKMEQDWKGELHFGIKLVQWNCKKEYVDISMPNYTHKDLVEYKHKYPTCTQNCPYASTPVRYGKESNVVTHEK